MTNEQQSIEEIKDSLEDILKQTKDLIQRGEHDLVTLSSCVHSMNDRHDLLVKYMEDGTIGTLCNDVAYYLDRLSKLAIKLETLTKIKHTLTEKNEQT